MYLSPPPTPGLLELRSRQITRHLTPTSISSLPPSPDGRTDGRKDGRTENARDTGRGEREEEGGDGSRGGGGERLRSQSVRGRASRDGETILTREERLEEEETDGD